MFNHFIYTHMSVRRLTSLLSFLLIGLWCSQAAMAQYKITGTVGPDYDGYIRLDYMDVVDSVKVKDGAFEFTGTVPHVVEAGLFLTNYGFVESVYFGNETVTVDIRVQGNRASLDGLESPTSVLMDSVVTHFTGIFNGDDDPIAAAYGYMEELLKGNPQNQFITELYSDIISEGIFSLEQAEALLKLIDTESMEPDYLESAQTTLARMRNLSVGSPFPEFEYTSLAGDVINQNTYKGKYVLVDFWASWCVPCREAHPSLQKIYERYSAKGFEIISVSIDRFEADWKLAVQKDDLRWTNIFVEGEFENPFAKQLGVVFLPFNYLIDPEGNIKMINAEPTDVALLLSEELK